MVAHARQQKVFFSLEIYGVIYKGLTTNIQLVLIIQDAILTVNGSIGLV